jgi:predicted O-methyltransferase YrrM
MLRCDDQLYRCRDTQLFQLRSFYLRYETLMEGVDLSRLEEALVAGWNLARPAPGYLSEKEARFLMAAAVLAPANGANIEIGSFKGRSTIALAYVARLFNLGRIVAIDPHTSPSITDPDLRGASSSYSEFVDNLDAAGVADMVESHRCYSQDFAKTWSGPIRLLWIDGDHTYEGAKRDLDLFVPHLAPGGVVLMHDVLGTHYGSLRVFTEHVLGVDAFGPAGFSGSIGWAQFRPTDGWLARFRWKRRLLSIPCRQIMPVALSPAGLEGWNKLRYKIWRPLAPHGPVNVLSLSKKLTMPAE